MVSIYNTFKGPWTTFPSQVRFLATKEVSSATITDLSCVFGDKIIPNNSDIQVLKKARQRCVLRLNTTSGSVIAKLFPLNNPFSILRHRKYARCEFLHYLRLQTMGIDTPLPLGFLEYRIFGFVRMSGLILEDIQGVDAWHKVTDEQSYLHQALATISTFISLYEHGVNHIDARDENLLRVGQRTVLIDWQYASYVAPRVDWLLEHLAAYFIRNAPKDYQPVLNEIWLFELHKAAQNEQPFTRFQANINALLNQKQSVKARLTLRPAKVVNI